MVSTLGTSFFNRSIHFQVAEQSYRSFRAPFTARTWCGTGRNDWPHKADPSTTIPEPRAPSRPSSKPDGESGSYRHNRLRHRRPPPGFSGKTELPEQPLRRWTGLTGSTSTSMTGSRSSLSGHDSDNKQNKTNK
jgi:hypothetical protein